MAAEASQSASSSSSSDREMELIEQSQKMSNEPMLERQIRVANAAKKRYRKTEAASLSDLKSPQLR
jgi:hypothetical protein